MKIALASDHAGFEYKQAIRDWLIAHGHDVQDFGTSGHAPVDYPDYIRPPRRPSRVANARAASFSAARAMARPSSPIRFVASAAAYAGARNPRASIASITTATSSLSASA